MRQGLSRSARRCVPAGVSRWRWRSLCRRGRLPFMAVSFYQLVIDAHDLPALARFWCQVLDWQVLFEDEDEIVIGADANALPGICFVPVGERKTVKNRLHIDLTPDDRAAEVERILGLGASRADRAGRGRDVDRPRRSRGQRVLRAAPEEVANGVIRVLAVHRASAARQVRQVPRGLRVHRVHRASPCRPRASVRPPAPPCGCAGRCTAGRSAAA